MTERARPDTAEDRPATYREVFASTEVIALFGSYGLSTAGSMLTRVAITFLVFTTTDSPLMAAAAFAISYAPYLGPAQILATLADRFPYRTTMISCDVVRFVLIGLVAIPGMPLWAMMTLVFASAMVAPAYQSSRAAMLQTLLTGERLTLALSVLMTLNQSSLLMGYFLGGVLASVDARMALVLNAAGFAVSALILWLFVSHRPAVLAAGGRQSLLTDTADGIRLVFGNPRLRLIAVVVFSTVAFTIIPEGAAAAWSAHLGGSAVLQGMIMASAPVAAIISSTLFARLVPPRVRRRLMRPLLLLAPVTLIVALFDPSAPGVVAIAVVCNLSAATVPILNASFIASVPDGFRARANGVMMSGVSLIQGAAVMSMGVLSQVGLSIPQSAGMWGVGGTLLILTLVVLLPGARGLTDPPTSPASARTREEAADASSAPPAAKT